MSIPERQKDTCPFCGSEEMEENGMFFKCGTYSNTVSLEEHQSELCKERELRQKAESELKLQTGRVAVLLGTIKERDLLKSANGRGEK